MRICFATNNSNKVKEVQNLLPEQIAIVSLEQIGCTSELEESQPTIEGNSQQKAEYVCKNFQVNVFADDTGLEVDALNGEPGVKSARYAGNQRDNEANIDLVLSKLVNSENKAFSLLGNLNSEYRAGRKWTDSYLALTHAYINPRGNPHILGDWDNEMVNWISPQSSPPMLPPYSNGAAVSGLISMLNE